jgi:hypothetical protein
LSEYVQFAVVMALFIAMLIGSYGFMIKRRAHRIRPRRSGSLRGRARPTESCTGIRGVGVAGLGAG